MLLAAHELAALLRANSFMRISRPPQLWDLETTELEPFVRAMGEMISAGLVRNGGDVAALELGAANLEVSAEASDPIPEGQFVAVSISGAGDWPDASWAPGDESMFVSHDLATALAGAGAAYAYSRNLGQAGGSVTVLYRRG